MRYMEFPNAVPGKVLKVEKYRDEASGLIKTRIGGIEHSGDELLLWEKQEEEIRLARNGNLSESLERRRLSMGKDETVRVVIYSKYPEVKYPDKTKVSEEVMIARSRWVASLPPLILPSELKNRNGLSGCVSMGSGKMVCNVNREHLQNLKRDPGVAEVDPFREEEPSGVELSTLAVSAYNPGPIPSNAGLGVRAATFEYGLTSSFVSCLGVPVTYDNSTILDKTQIQHTQATFKALVHAAPSATFYHRKSPFFDGAEDINYLINNGIQTVSNSLGRGGFTPYRSTRAEFLVMDDFAYRYPYPVFVNPAHNGGYQYEVNWQCYNAISVGNVRHTNETTFEMADCTQTRNPPPVYGACISGAGADCIGDREMPHLVAPGIPSTGTDFATTCLGGSGAVGCGTSLSAPVVNGLAAAMISADSRMSGWPEKVRAALILTAQNVDGDNWTTSGDERDGTGVVSGSDAVAFAQGHTGVYPGNGAVEKGMAAASMSASDFASGNKRFYFRVPNPQPANMHLRVVLTWDSNPVVGGNENALSDLDLYVQINGGTRNSGSWDSNVEVVDVPAGSLTAGGTYYIDIAPYANRIPSGSRTSFFYYALAWSWVKDHAP